MVVVQLVERSLPTPEIRGSNPDISNFFISCIKTIGNEKTKKKPGMAQLETRIGHS